MKHKISVLSADESGMRPLILRDVLAIDRTRLANERTLLAWLRTAIMLLVSGVTLIKLFEGITALEVMGALLIPLGLLTAAWGFRRYLHTRILIEEAEPIDRNVLSGRCVDGVVGTPSRDEGR
jgi:putative membrane protein